MSLLTVPPSMSCSDLSTNETKPCTIEQACSIGTLTNPSNGTHSISIDWEDSNSLNNWIVEFDLLCDSSVQVGMFGTAFFLGLLIAVVLFLRIGDLYGRINTMRTLYFIRVPLLIYLSYFSYSLYVFYLLSGVLGMINCLNY